MCKHTVWEQSCHFSDCEDTQLFKSHTYTSVQHTHTHTHTHRYTTAGEKQREGNSFSFVYMKTSRGFRRICVGLGKRFTVRDRNQCVIKLNEKSSEEKVRRLNVFITS